VLSGSAARRAGWLITGAAAVVALVALATPALVPPGPERTVILLVGLGVAFVLAAWRAIRARADPTETRGARSLRSWIAVFSWAATTFSVLVALVALAAPTSGARAALAGVLAGCVLVLVGRAGERVSSRV